MGRIKERGQGLVEYVLILVLIVMVIFVVLTLWGPAVRNVLQNIANGVTLCLEGDLACKQRQIERAIEACVAEENRPRQECIDIVTAAYR